MKRTGLLLLILFLGLNFIHSQELERNVEKRLTEFFSNYSTYSVNIGKPKLERFSIDHDKRKLAIYADERFAYQPFLPETVEGIYRYVKQILPGPVNFYDITIYVNDKSIEELIPNLYRDKQKDKSRLSSVHYKGEPWVKNDSRPFDISRGLNNKHISLWQSHGRYFDQKQNRWKWQRPPLFCTTEDLFTQSFVIPYLIPMLENAGAIVFTPRERDIQRNEVIVDNDPMLSNSLYIEESSRKSKWNTSSINGFAHTQKTYLDNQNPFHQGTARFIKTEKKSFKAFAEWVPNIPESGEYAVYVSYQTLPESITDAKYLVYHAGGVTEFKVNQQIGGGTWVYLGTFQFDKGVNDYGMVVLSNESNHKGVVCADGVRFGGGMGNIARGSSTGNLYTTSGLPRYLEAARYSAQWAGMPYSVYGNFGGENDYSDDIQTRGKMTNYLSGGSVYNPTEQGLGVPLTMTLGFHTDAGYSVDDKIIGTLGVYTTDFNDKKLNNGMSRYASRDLTDIIITDLVHDIRSQFAVDWKRRSMWDKNYGETRIPAVPSIILELLSHQNFADMQLGHDPNFKFAVGRSIYKSILRFLSSQHGEDYIVQPLPVSHFTAELGQKKNSVHLTWRGEEDPLEPTARPQEYMVYTRLGYGGFDNGVLVKGTSHTLEIEPGLVYSFKVTAVNRGGESFPSEILSAYIAPKSKGTVLIVNGFDRLSAPGIIKDNTIAGFDLERSPGIPYRYDISLCGVQTGFERKNAGKETKGGWGYSENELEGKQIAGNTFDYPFIHGKAIQAVGNYSFVSCSDEAVESGKIKLSDYPIVDFILGLEKSTVPEENYANTSYKTFTPMMQSLIRQYCATGGNIFVSGSYVGSDMTTPEERNFTREILKYDSEGSLTDTFSGEIFGIGRTLQIPRAMNEISYAVPTPDCLIPIAPAFPSFIYTTGNRCAGISYKENYGTFILGFPFESILSETDRAYIMAGILNFFEK